MLNGHRSKNSKKVSTIMTHSTITKQRYTLLEVQRLATTRYDLMVMPHSSHGHARYAVFFKNQLVSAFRKLVDIVAALPKLYQAILEQLALQEAASYDREVQEASNYLELPESLLPLVRFQSIDKNFIPGTVRYHYSLHTPDGAYIKSVEIFPQMEDKITATEKVYVSLTQTKSPVVVTQTTTEGKLKTNTTIMNDSDFVLTPSGATNHQVAYIVKHRPSGQQLGLIFDVHDVGWQCGDGENYKYPQDARNALIRMLIKFGCPMPDSLIPQYEAA